MPSSLPRLAALPALALAAACATYEPAGFDKVGPEYVTGGGTWNTGGGISAVARVLRRNGATVVCGAWTTDRQSALSAFRNDDVMAAGAVFLDGERLVWGLRFMQRVPWAENISGTQARCVTSAVPWRSGFDAAEPVLRFPRMAFAEGMDRGFSIFGRSVVFRQTPRADIAW